MADFMKKQSIGFWFSAIAIVAAIVGLIGMLVSNGVTTAYALANIGTLVLCCILGVALVCASAVAPVKLGNHNFVSAGCILLAIAAFGYVLNGLIMPRILLIAGLFSYDSVNVPGWSVFYAMVVGIVGLVVAILALIIGSFVPSVKKS